VLRDLAWLFNATAPGGAVDFSRAPQARKSVLNYGLPALSGQTASTIDPLVLQNRVRQAILDHEPRILPETLQVEAVISEMQLDHHNQIGFRISGQLWAQPVPLELLLHTDIDLETGRVAVRESDR
ncbi:MAG: GPW/gp25 family protein, partial [Rubrivivax sp.]